ncbi:MAG TPA: TIGR00725 family protein [Mesotoga sp.]|jgi:uncharacterized protein (TIGR00725 family)|nr:TIGR00725 family protein [Mesotoga sp.]MDI9376443.1 TIGR00725 family protein [Thermotogota bacterium]MDD4478754.1 TIGR00725 family protein [Mesotoga sp.]MDD5744380.1 TIGR00725 family protein [Mesotoga sp.]HOY27080.1 TIGR00725 family protein [Mesotoga sp.]
MLQVAVIGYSGPIDRSPVLELTQICRQVGKALAERGDVLITGGRDGVMELVSESASSNGGRVLGILPSNDEGNDHNQIKIRTGMDFALRSLIISKSADVVISIGGEAGTLLEILSSYSYGRPVILMKGTGGWTDRILPVMIEGRYLDNRRTVEIRQAQDMAQLLECLEEAENGKV